MEVRFGPREKTCTQFGKTLAGLLELVEQGLVRLGVLRVLVPCIEPHLFEAR